MHGRSTTGAALAVLVMLCAGPTSTAPTSMAWAPRVQDAAARSVPADLLDLTSWKLTLPAGGEEKPEEVTQPELDRYSDPFFRLSDTRDGVVFAAEAGGATTSGSDYPRSELREMAGSNLASWSNTKGRHVLSVRQSVVGVPPNKPEVVTVQIHDGEDDVLQIRLEGSELSVQYDDGHEKVVLDPDYVLGTLFDVDVVAENGEVRVYHNGLQRAVLDLSGSGWYFKVGSYVQSNPEHDEPDAVGEVLLHFLELDHA